MIQIEKSYYCIYCPNILKNCQRETKLFEFSQDKNREKLKKTTQDKSMSLCSAFVIIIITVVVVINLVIVLLQ